MDLQAEQERVVQRIGLEPKGRKFIPHVTLARLRDSSEPGGRRISHRARTYFPSQAFLAARFVLFSSRASAGGDPYIVEDAYELCE